MAAILISIIRIDAAGQSQSESYDVHQIEAAFIYNFIDFVTWPDGHHAASDGRLTIGVLGDDPFGDAFSPVEGKRVLGKTLTVRKSRRLEDLLDSWILFISPSEASRVGEILSALETRPVLTVSDMDQFVRNGGMIQFYSASIGGEIKIRFDISKNNVDQSGLKMSFRLLSLARPKP